MKHSKTSSLVIVLAVYLSTLILAQLLLDALPATASVLTSAFLLDLAATFLVFLFSLILNNSSVYDPYWSVVPPVIIWYWLNGSGSRSLPSLLLILLVVLWCVRLTLNWIRGWGGLRHEDWRYAEFRERFGPWYWLVSFWGIHLFPTLIVFFGLIPVYLTIMNGMEQLTLFHITGLLLSLFGTLLELVADEQLRKHRSLNKGTFVNRGLWKYSRHPNYLGEIVFWTGLWVFGLDGGKAYLWTLVAPLSMAAMFIFVSAPWMERKIIRTRPAYRQYMNEVPVLLPLRIKGQRKKAKE